MMRVLVLDDGRKQAEPIREAFFKKKIDAIVCSTSNDFLAAVNTPNKFEAVYINAETWNRGRCIYDYFGVGPRLEGKTAVVYNADEKFAHIKGRNPTERDRLLAKPSSVETALAD